MLGFSNKTSLRWEVGHELEFKGTKTCGHVVTRKGIYFPENHGMKLVMYNLTLRIFRLYRNKPWQFAGEPKSDYYNEKCCKLGTMHCMVTFTKRYTDFIK